MSDRVQPREERREERREEHAWWARIALPAAGFTVVGFLALIAWLLLRPGVDRLEPITTVNEAGDTIVYSGRVRDAVARARIIEALNSVPARAEDTVGRVGGSDSARIAAAAVARAARQAAVDELARLYADPVDPEAVVAALNRAIIDFQPGSADLPADAAGFIQAAAEVIQRTPEGTTIVVVGHTEAGMEARNAAGQAKGGTAEVALAEQRAQAVVGAVVEAGAEAGRLRAETREGDSSDATDGSEGGIPKRRIFFAVAEAAEIEPAADSLDDPARSQSDSVPGDAPESPADVSSGSSPEPSEGSSD